MKMPWLKLIPFARATWPGWVVVLGLTSCITVLEALKPWPLKFIVDYVLPGRPFEPRFGFLNEIATQRGSFRLLLLLTCGTVVLYLATWFCRALQSYVVASTGSSMYYALSGHAFDHLQRLSLSFHRQHKTGDLIKRVVRDSECIRQLAVQVALPLLSSLFSLVVMLLIMSRLNTELTLVAAAVIPILAWTVWHFAGTMNERTYRQYAVQGEVAAFAEQTLAALPVVKAFTRESHEDERFSRLWQRADDAFLGAVNSQTQFRISTGTVTACGTAALMALGGWKVNAGQISAGDLIIFLAYLTSLYTPLETLAFLSTGFAAASAGAQRVCEVLDSRDSIPELPGAATLDRVNHPSVPAAEWNRVTFGYRSGKPILSQVCVELRRGERLALVGATGAGKSTLVSLLPRFYDPWEGTVRVNGTDVREVKLASLRDQLSLVLQEPQLFPWSISENIALGKSSATLAEIEAAARAAHCHEFICRLPHGYQTVLRERGSDLSAGERQRLALARAFLKNAPILVLDEPSSALDSETEHLLIQAQNDLMQGRSVILIAHRLSTVRQADRIAVLDNGRIIDIGIHEELLERASRYLQLFQISQPAHS